MLSTHCEHAGDFTRHERNITANDRKVSQKTVMENQIEKVFSVTESHASGTPTFAPSERQRQKTLHGLSWEAK